MNNGSLNQFAIARTNLDMGRSRFKRPHRHITSFKTGQLIPVYWSEVLPGDTVSMDVGSLVRMMTPLYPVMDDAYLDVHAYFVPNRLLWSHWEEFLGANKSTYWTQPVTYVPPKSKLEKSTNYVYQGSIADYLGLPVDDSKFATQAQFVSALPFRAYALIWNEWYRDENTMQPCNVDTGDTTSAVYRLGRANGSLTYSQYISQGTYVTRGQFGDLPLPVCKLHDYFTSALPAPQKGAAVNLPAFSTSILPVKNLEDMGVTLSGSNVFNPKYYGVAGAALAGGTGFHNLGAYKASSATDLYYDQSVDTTPATGGHVYQGLGVSLADASATTINALREAFAVQRFLEKAARGGTRYTEILSSFFGVTSSDASLQRPQYLGGRRVPINMTQVAQTSATGSNGTPQGNLAAFSQTLDGNHLFTQSFEEHGILMIMACVRTRRSYQQGIAKKWSRFNLTDYYFPVFANLGEQPIYKREIYCDNANGDGIFGYQEAWAEYRYDPDEITGLMRSTGSAGFDSWHYADYYTSMPTLTADWIREPQENVERTLAVTNTDHFIAEFAFDATWVRPMPLYSIPGLIDHH